MAANERFLIGNPEEVDLLTCPICLEAFDSDQRKPRSLQCLHTFCHGCLEDYSTNKVSITCPTCRRDTPLPTQGVKGLPHNFWISNIAQGSKPSTAGGDRKEGDTSTCQCALHPKMEAIFLCDCCDVLVCSECVASRHRGHPMTLIPDVLRQKTTEVQSAVRSCQERAMQCLETIEMIEKVEANLDAQKGDNVAKILASKEATIANIDANERALLDVVVQKHHEKSRTFLDCRKRLVQLMDQMMNGIHQASEAIKRKDIQGMIAASASMETTLPEDITKALPAMSEEVSLGIKFVPSKVLRDNIHLGTLKPVVGIEDDGDEERGNNDAPQQKEFTVHRIGKTGGKDREFKVPRGISNSGTCCLVVDSDNKRVQALESGGLIGGLFSCSRNVSIGWSFWDLLMLRQSSWQPHDVATSNDAVYVTDVQHNVVRKFLSNGKYSGLFGWDMLKKPTYIAVDSNDGVVVVADKEGREVGVYRPSNAFIHKFSVVSAPVGIAVNKEGLIVVSMEGAPSVSTYTRHGQLRGITELGVMPGSICTDVAGNLVVVDSRQKRVLLFDPKGTLRRVLLSAEHGLRKPWDVAVVNDGVLVSDCELNCLFYVRRNMPGNV